MPVKKTTKMATKTIKKTTVAKKPIKKTVTKKTAVAKKPSVVVETKKTNNSSSTCALKDSKPLMTLFILLLLGNLVFGILNFMKQDSALKLEEMKVGGHENFEKVMQLYESDFYKEQQSAAIQQFMGQVKNPIVIAEPTE